MGRHEVGFVENTVKTPISNGEGCLFEARFKINKVLSIRNSQQITKQYKIGYRQENNKKKFR